MKFKLLVETYLIESLNSVIKDTKDIPEDIIRQYYSNALPDNNKSDSESRFSILTLLLFSLSLFSCHYCSY